MLESLGIDYVTQLKIKWKIKRLPPVAFLRRLYSKTRRTIIRLHADYIEQSEPEIVGCSHCGSEFDIRFQWERVMQSHHEVAGVCQLIEEDDS